MGGLGSQGQKVPLELPNPEEIRLWESVKTNRTFPPTFSFASSVRYCRLYLTSEDLILMVTV